MNTKSLKIYALIYGFLVLGTKLAQAMPSTLHTSGTSILNAQGCAVRLVGCDIDSLEWDPLGYGPSGGSGIAITVQEAISYWHVNCIRIPLNEDYWFGYSNSQSTGYESTVSASAYQGIVDSIVTLCNANNVYVDLDLHWSNQSGWGTATKQYSMPGPNSVTFWESVAARYANNPSVLFDLYNEPFPSTWTIWKSGPTTDEGFSTPGFQALLNDVRATTASASSSFASGTNALNICLVGGQGYAYSFTGGFTPLTDSTGNGVIYTTHIYDNKSVNTATGTGGWETEIDPALEANVPVMVEEFGNINSQSSPAYTQSVIAFLQPTGNDKNYTYSAMSWDLCTTAGPLLISSWNSTPAAPAASGSTWTLTSYQGVPVYAWLTSTTQATCSTETPTPTETFTAVPTATATSTRTATPSMTPSDSPSASPTDSPTRTVSYSPSVSVTNTFTSKATETSSPTATSVPATGTSSPTATSVSGSPTSSPTATNVSGAPTSSPTATNVSGAPTSSPTATNVSGAPTSSPTATSVSGSPTSTATPEATAVPATSTATPETTAVPATPSATSEATATVAVSDLTAVGQGPLKITAAFPVPNPNPHAIAVQLSGAADSVEATWFTEALVVAQRETLPGGPVGWNSLALQKSGVAPGIYYVRLVAQRGGAVSSPLVVKVLWTH